MLTDEEKELRARVADVHTERLDAFLAQIHRMKFSDLVLMLNPHVVAEQFSPTLKFSVAKIASSAHTQSMKEANDARELAEAECQAAMFACIDEIDRRMPVPA